MGNRNSYLRLVDHIGKTGLNKTAITINLDFLKALKIALYIVGVFLVLFGLYNLSSSIGSTAYTVYGYEGVFYSLILIGMGIGVFIITSRHA